MSNKYVTLEDEKSLAMRLYNQSDRRISLKNLGIITRYLFQEGKNDEFIMEYLKGRFLYQYPESDDDLVTYYCKYILEKARTLPPLDYCKISFTNAELDFIHSFDDLPFEKYMFIMCCLYKMNGDKPFAAKESIIRSAMKEPSVKKTKEIHAFAYKAIQSKVLDSRMFHGNNVKEILDPLKSLSSVGDVVLTITNKTNLVYYYLGYIGVIRTYICQRCGEVGIATCNRSKYCEACAREVLKQQQRDFVREKRKNVEN